VSSGQEDRTGWRNHAPVIVYKALFAHSKPYVSSAGMSRDDNLLSEGLHPQLHWWFL